jgi:hypothetical protein
LLKVMCLSILKISPYIIPDISAANKSFKKWENVETKHYKWFDLELSWQNKILCGKIYSNCKGSLLYIAPLIY